MTKVVRARVLRNFNGMRAGDEGEVPLTERLIAFVGLGLMKVVVDGGKDQAGPGRPAKGDAGRVGEGAADSGAPGGEQGQGFGSGGYGSAESFD